MPTFKKQRGKWLFPVTVWPVLICVLPYHGCRKPPPRPNILLISIDTCRADHLGCYGKRGAGTRHLDALASQAVQFKNVVTRVPLTLPAHSSLHTGTLPPFTQSGTTFSTASAIRPSRWRNGSVTTGATVAAVATVDGIRTAHSSKQDDHAA